MSLNPRYVHIHCISYLSTMEVQNYGEFYSNDHTIKYFLRRSKSGTLMQSRIFIQLFKIWKENNQFLQTKIAHL